MLDVQICAPMDKNKSATVIPKLWVVRYGHLPIVLPFVPQHLFQGELIHVRMYAIEQIVRTHQSPWRSLSERNFEWL